MDIALVLKAIGEPTRFKIIKSLSKRKYCVRALACSLKITESAVSQHLKILKEANCVNGIKFGYHTHYFINNEFLDYLILEFQNMKKQLDILEEKEENCDNLHCKKIMEVL